MGQKLKILFHTLNYPMCIGAYFRRALERRDDIELKTTGITTGSWIPWKGGINLPQKYAYTPDIPLPYHFSNPVADYEYVKAQLQGWKPDLIITVDAGSHWHGRPSEGFVAHVATDAHCLVYDKQRRDSDKFFNMHERYSKSGDVVLPYAYDPSCHYVEPETEKIYDVAMVGVEYQHRIELAEKLRSEGLRVLFSNGDIFDEYRHSNNQAIIGINWSSLDDLNARAFELPAMGCIPVMNKVSDMNLDRHRYFDYSYLFECDNNADHNNKSRYVDGAVRQVRGVLDNLQEAKEKLSVMKEMIKSETYDARVQQIISECGFGG